MNFLKNIKLPKAIFLYLLIAGQWLASAEQYGSPNNFENIDQKESWKIKTHPSNIVFGIETPGLSKVLFEQREKYTDTFKNGTLFQQKKDVIFWGEWGYSFHKLKGKKDGSGVVHQGGYNGKIKTRQEAYRQMKNYIITFMKSQKKSAAKKWVSMNGHFPYHHYSADMGFSYIGTENGENIKSYQLNLAFNRGAARQFNLPWFLDFSAWNGSSINDWSYKKTWRHSSPQGGHSLNLFQRVYYSSYMYGASQILAEGGYYNFFEVDKEGKVKNSPLGKIGTEFNSFIQENPDRGIPYTPYCLLVDFHHGTHGLFQGKSFDHFKYDKEDFRTQDVLREFIPSLGKFEKNSERYVISPTPFGESYDVFVTHDEKLKAIHDYPVLILAGIRDMSQAVQKSLHSYLQQGGILLLAEDQYSHFSKPLKGKVVTYKKGAFASTLNAIHQKIMPVQVRGDIQFLLNRKKNSWLLTLINNDVIQKSGKIIIDSNNNKKVNIEANFDVLKIQNLRTKQAVNSKSLNLSIRPGEIHIYEIFHK